MFYYLLPEEAKDKRLAECQGWEQGKQLLAPPSRCALLPGSGLPSQGSPVPAGAGTSQGCELPLQAEGALSRALGARRAVRGCQGRPSRAGAGAWETAAPHFPRGANRPRRRRAGARERGEEAEAPRPRVREAQRRRAAGGEAGRRRGVGPDGAGQGPPSPARSGREAAARRGGDSKWGRKSGGGGAGREVGPVLEPWGSTASFPGAGQNSSRLPACLWPLPPGLPTPKLLDLTRRGCF